MATTTKRPRGRPITNPSRAKDRERQRVWCRAQRLLIAAKALRESRGA